MSKRKNSGHEEGGGGHGVGLWYISFSDMITLLLSFFVMLATFSSYDKESLEKFAGAVRYISTYSVFGSRNSVVDSVMPPPPRTTDFTEDGSEKPDHMTDEEVRNPRRLPWVPDSMAFRDRKVLYIPSSRLFLAESSILSPDGVEHMRMIGKFVKAIRCQVIVSESRPAIGAASTLEAARLDRSAAIVQCLSDIGLPPERMGVSAANSDASASYDNQPVIEISLLSGGVRK